MHPPQAARASSQPVNHPRYAEALDKIIGENHAYEHRWPGGSFARPPQLVAERHAVRGCKLLIHAEERIVTRSSDALRTTSSAILPTYADLWVQRVGGNDMIGSVRERILAAGERLSSFRLSYRPGESLHDFALPSSGLLVKKFRQSGSIR